MHIVGTNTIDIISHDRDKANGLQNRISLLFQEHLFDAMSAVFDRYAPENKLIRIDRLVIDIASVSLDDLEVELPSRIIAALQNAIDEYSSGNSMDMQASCIPCNNATNEQKLDAVGFFLLHGVLPWYATGPSKSPVDVLPLLINEEPAAVLAILYAVGKQADVRQRIVNQLNEKTIAQLVTILEPAQADTIVAFHAAFTLDQETNQIVKARIKEFKTSLWYFILTYLLVDSGGNFSIEEFAKGIMLQIAQHYNVSFHNMTNILFAVRHANDPLLQNIGMKQIETTTAAQTMKIDKTEDILHKDGKFDKPMIPEKIYVDNAGIVLLHPFLGTYFSRLGMLENGQFINDEARLRGAHLLQYIAFGTEWHPEHKMPLNKLLLNIPLSTTLPLDIALTDNEKEVSIQLLGAIIQNWDKLKSTSVDGLRTSFLQREGVIFKENDEWTLMVVQRGYDILLQTLPWSISMIKPQWMHQIIQVRWI